MEMWLIIKQAGRLHAWQVDDTADDDLIRRAKVVVGFPAGDGWIHDPAQTHAVRLTTDRPTGATIRDRSELGGVPAEVLATYEAQCHAAQRQARIAEARATVLALSPEDRAQLYADVPPPPRGTTTTGGRS